MANNWSSIPAPDHHHAAWDPHPYIPDVGAGRGSNGIDPECPDCHRQDPGVQWRHAIDCRRYLPHPDSIAAATIPVGGHLSNEVLHDAGPLRWVDVPGYIW